MRLALALALLALVKTVDYAYSQRLVAHIHALVLMVSIISMN